MNELKGRLVNHISSNNLKQNDVATKIGYSETSLSQWLAGTYKADTKKMDENIKSYLDREEARTKEIVKNPDFVATETAKIIFDSARQCHLDKRMRVITGAAGTGKTTAIKEYKKRNTGVICLTSSVTMTPPRLYKSFYKEIGLSGRCNSWDMEESIIASLKDTDSLVVIDEAEYLPTNALDIARKIHEDCNVGLLLVGTEKLYYNLSGRKNQHAMLWSRVVSSWMTERLNLSEIESIVKQYFKDLDKEVIKSFEIFSDGNARALRNLIINVSLIANRTQQNINPMMIKAAFEASMKA
jgi:hypothetical protein